MHRVIGSAPAGISLRLLLITLLLAGLALTGDRHCANDAMPLAQAAATSHAETDHPHSDMANVQTDSHGRQHPGGLLGLCLSVLAAVTAALVLIGRPAGMRALLSRVGAHAVAVAAAAVRPLALAQLGVSRT